MDTDYRPNPHQVMAHRVRERRRAQRPALNQEEAAHLFGLSQSAYSRLENGETQSWKPSAIAGAAKLLGISEEDVLAGLSESHPMSEINMLRIRLEEIAAETSDIRNLFVELIQKPAPGMREFGALVQAVRMSRGYTLHDAAAMMGAEINSYTLDRIEQGNAEIRSYATRLASFLRIDEDTIFQYAEANGHDDHSRMIAEMQLLVNAWDGDLAIAQDALDASTRIIQEIKAKDKHDAQSPEVRRYGL